MTEEKTIFDKIKSKEIPAKIVYEDEHVLAFHDVNPQAPVHLLIIPKKHIARISESEGRETSLLGSMILCAKELARQKQVEDGFRLVFNNGAKAGQSVFHIHLHLLAGRSMKWPPG
jgi:histidine triad (HIT) family protein